MSVYPLLNEEYQLEIYSSIECVKTTWSQIAPSHDAFLQVPYFQFLESRPPKDISFRYLLISKDQQPIGIISCQLVQLRIGEALKNEDLPMYQQKINSFILKVANMNAIISGNLLLAGNHGSYFVETITPELQGYLLKEALEVLKTILKVENHHISLLIHKDIPLEKHPSLKSALGKTYNEFSFQPNMIMELPQEWQSFEDYMQALHSKARVRAKKAFKQGKDIIKKEFTVDLIKAFLPQIDHLYKCIADKAGFNILYLDGAYFLHFKEYFPEDFRIFGYFIGDELIAFYTSFRNHQELEAHYLGFEDTTNRTYQTYLNILFDLIRLGIEMRVKKINFARTALEIKSSVGAQPESLYYFGKHTNPIKNQIFSPVLSYFQPKIEWQPRSPFKKIEQ